MRGFVFFACCIFLCSGVFALSGVSPPVYEVDFQPNFSEEFVFDFIAEEGVVSDLYVVGDLSEYVVLDKNSIIGSDKVTASLNLPHEVSSPGVNIIRIAARQNFDGDGGIGISAEVRGLIRINVPYPGKYVGLDLVVSDANVGDDVDLRLTASSLGKEDVVAEILLQVFDSKNEIVKNFNFGSHLIKSGESAEFFEVLNTDNYVFGNYTATALSYYDESFSRDDVDFRLGKFYIGIINYSRSFVSGKINRFDIEVESFWNNVIEDFYVEVFILDSDVNFSTGIVSLNPWEKKVVSGFLDTNNLPNNNFQANIILHYGNDTNSEIVDLSVVNFKNYSLFYFIFGFVILGLVVWSIWYYINRVR